MASHLPRHITPRRCRSNYALFLRVVRQGHYNAQELQQEDSYLREFQGANPTPIQKIGLKHLNLKAEAKNKRQKKSTSGATAKVDTAENLAALAEVPYSHLHNRTQYSVYNLPQN